MNIVYLDICKFKWKFTLISSHQGEISGLNIVCSLLVIVAVLREALPWDTTGFSTPFPVLHSLSVLENLNGGSHEYCKCMTILIYYTRAVNSRQF